MYYKGWLICEFRTDGDPRFSAPVTGRFQAFRHGVRCCAGTLEQLRLVIDLRQPFAAWWKEWINLERRPVAQR